MKTSIVQFTYTFKGRGIILSGEYPEGDVYVKRDDYIDIEVDGNIINAKIIGIEHSRAKYFGIIVIDNLINSTIKPGAIIRFR